MYGQVAWETLGNFSLCDKIWGIFGGLDTELYLGI